MPDFFDRHPRFTKLILVLLFPTIPFVALWNGVPDVFHGWLDDWRYFGEDHGDR